MQAFANEVAEKQNKTANSEQKTFGLLEESSSLFSANEIIFPGDNVDRPYTRYGYHVGNFNFLVPEGTVSEVIKNASIFMLPNSPSWIEGLINIRGNIIPVMNISKLLKIHDTNKPDNILIFDKTDSHSAIGILINKLPVSLEIGESKDATKNYPELLSDYIKTGFNQKNADWVEFDPQDLFKKLANK